MKFLLLTAAILAPAAAQAFSLNPKEIPPSYTTKQCYVFQSGDKHAYTESWLCVPHNGEEPYIITGRGNAATGEIAVNIE